MNEQMKAHEIGVLPEGRRNDGLARLAGALRRTGATYEQIESELLEHNQRRCRPPLSGDEIIRIARSVAGYQIGGPDPLDEAWQVVISQGHDSNYQKFVALAHQLQTKRPGQPVALPVERISVLMGVHYTMVGVYRKHATADGILRLDSNYIANRRATTYRVLPSEILTSILSSGLVRVPSESAPPSESLNSSPSENQRVQQILRLAARQFQLFPCKPKDKIPLVKWRAQATCKVDRIRQWEKKYPECNWAVATGEGSGVFVLDIDGIQGLRSFIDQCERAGDNWTKVAESTLGVKTGRGTHLYFDHPDRRVRNSASDIGEGLDVRADGGYVIAPPSVHPSGDPYTWLGRMEDRSVAQAPGWLLELVG